MFMLKITYLQIVVSNVFFIFKLEANLISHSILKQMKYEFCTINGLLYKKD